jgi:hypothetical protein
MLRDVLGLETEPQIRPAAITGYQCKLWGQYPAPLGAPENVVHGAVYHVETEEHGERLASYETDNYRADPCRINYTDGKEPVDDFGFVFKFVGNVRDLSDGTFDLGTWLRRMKRVAEDSSDVKELQTRKACMKLQAVRDDSPIFRFCKSGIVGAVCEFLRKDASVKNINSNGWGPLHVSNIIQSL